MADLNPCSHCGAPAVEQFRGEYHKGNRADVRENHRSGNLLVEMDSVTELSFRIACSNYREHDHRDPFNVPKCGNAMGWNEPTLQIAAKMREAWNKDNPTSVQQYGV